MTTAPPGRAAKTRSGPPVTRYLVVQQGGSSREFYACTYTTEAQAVAAIRRHRRASYNAIGPFPIRLVGRNPAEFEQLSVFAAIEAACAAAVGL
jgi:hypothetical protein